MSTDPTVWILWRRRKGDLDQMLGLVQALGWPYEIKTLSFRRPDIPAFAGLLLKSDSDSLTPPWPDVVFCAEALPSIIAAGLKMKSNGAIKTVCIGRPAGTPAAFDLVITTAQYRVRPAANVVELSMPLPVPKAGAAPADDGVDVKRPLIALLVGGSSFPDVLEDATARRLAADIRRHAEDRGGTLVVLTSPRTGRSVVQALAEIIEAPHRLHVFGLGDNHYREALACADEIIVTSDSVSMVADALETGKPVSVYPLPQNLNLQWRFTEWLYDNAVVKRVHWLLPVAWLFDKGVIESNADRRLLFGRLADSRRLSWFGGKPPLPQPDASRADATRALESLRAMVT